MQIPYTYLIGWSKYNKFYYGAKYGIDANPENFWKNYFTSSKYVKEYREKFGEPDIIEIRKTFDNPYKAQEWEKKVLRRLDILNKDYWLNKNVGGRFYLPELTEEHRLKISKSNSKPKGLKGRLACQRNSKIAAQKRIGQKDSDETKLKKSEKAKEYHKKAKKLGISRKPHVAIKVGNEIFYGYKSVAEKFGITTTTVYNRVKNDKYKDWIKL